MIRFRQHRWPLCLALSTLVFSPVTASGRIYFISPNGAITVIDATANTLTVLA
jgi:hypothetical protein